MRTYYEILQVTPEASEEVIKAAYRSLTKKYHPDSGLEKDSEKFLRIEEAYTVLMDEHSRRKYDEMLREQKMKESQSEESHEERQRTSEVVNVSKDNSQSKDDKQDLKSKKHVIDFGGILQSIISIAFWAFIIACFVTNMEQHRMNLYKFIGKYEFNSDPGDYEACIHVKYETALIKKTPKVWLNVDGKRVAILKEGDSCDYECKLSSGKHIVFVESKYFHVNSDIYTITVLPESEYTLADCSVTGKWGWGADFTVNDTYR